MPVEVQVKVSNNVFVKATGETHKDVFESIAELQEVFGESCCGRCQSTDIVYKVREVDGNNFYELQCKSCRSKLSFGQNKKGGKLFPVRKLNDEGKADSVNGKWDAKHNGWMEPYRKNS